MNNSISTLKIGGLKIEHAGWKYYNIIRKKAMEQEFSMSGLIVSLSIAFFIVIATSYSLSLMYKSINIGKSLVENKINGVEKILIIEKQLFADVAVRLS